MRRRAANFYHDPEMYKLGKSQSNIGGTEISAPSDEVDAMRLARAIDPQLMK